MKKAYIAVAAALIILTAWLVISRIPAPEAIITFDGVRDTLVADLTCDAGSRTLRGTQTLTAVNRAGVTLDEILLRAPMSAFGGRTTVAHVMVNGESVPCSADPGDDTVLRIDRAWAADETIRIDMTVMLTYPRTDGAAILTLPQIALAEDGAWRTDAFDALSGRSYAAAMDVRVTVDGQIAAQLQGAREASFAVAPDAKPVSKDVGGVRVIVMGATWRETRRLLSAAENALHDLEKAGFAYPFASLRVASAQAEGDGLSLSGLVALSPQKDADVLRRQLTRLIAQQTFGTLVENDPWNAPWLSVSLASAAELLCYRMRAGQQAYEERFFGEVEIATRVTRPAGVTVGAGTAHFGSVSEMTQVLRDQGGAMLMGVAEAVGYEAFADALRAYAQACAHGFGSLDALCGALEAATGSDWRGYLTDELSL